jgi:hypothetical protein
MAKPWCGFTVSATTTGVTPADVEIGNVGELAGKYPAIAADLRAIAASVPPPAPGRIAENK